MSSRFARGCLGLLLLGGCRSTTTSSGPPPDAKRPALRAEADLAAERSERITSGEIVASPTRELEVERRPPPPPARAASRAIPGDIRSGLLLINDNVLTAPQVLYPLRAALREAREKFDAAAFENEAALLIRRQTQDQIGAALVYAEALRELAEPQRKALDKAVTQEIDGRVDRDFGGSKARLTGHLARFQLSDEQYREMVKRALVVQSFTRERFMPQVQVRRAELLDRYRRSLDEYSTAETRELLLIEIPFSSFAPPASSWDTLPAAARAPAKLRAMRLAREAHVALRTRPFEDVARGFSRGPHAEQGGVWGPIGKPLQAPYDAPSERLFQLAPGQVSEPIETDYGWFIVQCGAVTAAHTPTFAEVQERIRTDLANERFADLANSYVLRLAEKATYSSLDAFVESAEQVAAATDWLAIDD